MLRILIDVCTAYALLPVIIIGALFVRLLLKDLFRNPFSGG